MHQLHVCATWTYYYCLPAWDAGGSCSSQALISHHRAANAAAARDDIFHGETDAPGMHSACLLPCIDLYVCIPFLFQ
jgi:hypothetical protein